MKTLREALGNALHAYRKRLNYAWGATICLECSYAGVNRIREISTARSVIGGITLDDAGLAVLSVALTLFWPVTVWQRISDIGVASDLAALWLLGLVASWGWFLMGGAHAELAFGVFLALQIPLLGVAGRKGVTQAEGGGPDLGS